MVVAFVSVLVLFHYKLLSNALALSIEHLLFVVSFMIWMLFVEKTKQRRILMQISYKKTTTSQAKIHCNCYINLLVLSVFLLFRTFISETFSLSFSLKNLSNSSRYPSESVHLSSIKWYSSYASSRIS